MKHIFLYIYIYIYIFFFYYRIPHTWNPLSWGTVRPASTHPTSMVTLAPSWNQSTPHHDVNTTTTQPSIRPEETNWRMGLGLGFGLGLILIAFVLVIFFQCRRKRRENTASRESLLMSDLMRRQGENIEETEL